MSYYVYVFDLAIVIGNYIVGVHSSPGQAALGFGWMLLCMIANYVASLHSAACGSVTEGLHLHSGFYYIHASIVSNKLFNIYWFMLLCTGPI